MDALARSSLSRMFHGFPGEDQIGRMLLRKLHTELGKMTEEKLQDYLHMFERLGCAIRTGEGFRELMDEEANVPKEEAV